MRAVATFLGLTRGRRFRTEDGGRALLERPKRSSEPPARVLRGLDVRREQVHGRPVHVLSPAGGPRTRGTVVYLHGGAYVSTIVRQHWALVAEVVREVGCEVRVPLYGLAPDHHAPEAIALVRAVLDGARGPTYLLGDSAGGGLALATTQRVVEDGGTAPAGLTLVAPWLDLGLRNPEIPAIQPHDPWLSLPGLRPLAAAWADGLSYDDPRVSPLFGRLDGLPPIALHVGTRDITLADCRELRDRAPSGGLTVHEVPGAVHVHPLLPVPEGRVARGLIVDEVRRGLGV